MAPKRPRDGDGHRDAMVTAPAPADAPAAAGRPANALSNAAGPLRAAAKAAADDDDNATDSGRTPPRHFKKYDVVRRRNDRTVDRCG